MNLLVTQETWVQTLGQEDPLGKGMAIHSSILAWRIPGQRSLACSMGGSQRVGHDWATNTIYPFKVFNSLVIKHLEENIESIYFGFGKSFLGMILKTWNKKKTC